jgi:hypothetical protein
VLQLLSLLPVLLCKHHRLMVQLLLSLLLLCNHHCLMVQLLLEN